ncbi:uncharacterized protein B0H64DRAFT_60453 [Chaetomium fimeti]|uniref:Uncharacterized protein n=1 Tax=Chaetomium fimeti TaxID=1854472 RepID=A0AAE0LMP2_9PEZI|nr:hypothetical protein B0H64DRAFT_60453 [Chaetomium fimeti]
MPERFRRHNADKFRRERPIYTVHEDYTITVSQPSIVIGQYTTTWQEMQACDDRIEKLADGTIRYTGPLRPPQRAQRQAQAGEAEVGVGQGQQACHPQEQQPRAPQEQQVCHPQEQQPPPPQEQQARHPQEKQPLEGTAQPAITINNATGGQIIIQGTSQRDALQDTLFVFRLRNLLNGLYCLKHIRE